MDDKPILKYFTGTEAEQFTFYKIPKLLFSNKYFSDISTDAKVLYGLMLDRIGLSLKNGWMDDENRAYIFFSVEETMEYLHCKKNKAIQTIAELDSGSGIGLIEKMRQGQGKPTRIYVKSFFIPLDEASENNPEVGKINFKRFEKQTSRSLKNKPLEVGKTNPNKNKYNNTDINDNESYLIISGEDKIRLADKCNLDRYAKQIKDNIDFDALITQYPYDLEVIQELYELILETLISQKDEIIIATDRYPAEFVKARFKNLHFGHIEYVLLRMKQTTTKIKNIKKYMLAMLFNSYTTVGSYYKQDANRDMNQSVS